MLSRVVLISAFLAAGSSAAPSRNDEAPTPNAPLAYDYRHDFHDTAGYTHALGYQYGYPDPPQRVTGTVVGLTDVAIPGTKLTHRVAQVSTRSGAVVAVDLGKAEDVDNWGLRRGAKLSAVGPFTVLDRQGLMPARTVRIGDTTHAVARDRSYLALPRPYPVEGVVLKPDRKGSADAKAKESALFVQTPDGARYAVPAAALSVAGVPPEPGRRLRLTITAVEFGYPAVLLPSRVERRPGS